MRIETESGYFDIARSEFVITDMKAVRPLKNYLWNESVVAWYDQFGCGIANGKTDGVFRTLTNYPKYIFVKDVETGAYYSPNRNFDDLPFETFACHVGLGYQRVISTYLGLRFEITTIIPQKDYAEITHIQVSNIGDQQRKLRVYFYNKPFVNLTWHDAFGGGEGVPEENGLLFNHVGFNIPEKNTHVFTKANYPIASYEVTDLNFKGIYHEISHPAALEKNGLSNQPTIFDADYCSAMEFALELAPDQTEQINVVCCFGKSKEEVFATAGKYVANESYQQELAYQRQWHNQLNQKMTISTGNGYLDLLENVWLKRQVSLGKTWGRVYGKGFRDIMQDVSSFLSLDSQTAKQKILSTLEYQKENGNTIRQFDPIFDYPYQDGASWIAQTVLAYLKETDDGDILDAPVRYYQSELCETVFEHMARGYRYLLSDLGQNGLVLWRGGDWNDSIDNAGMNGIGESVWLSIATIAGINAFLEIAARYKPDVCMDDYVSGKEKLEHQIMTVGFEGGRFIYGIDDLSRRVGSKESEYVKIFLNPQTWSVIANIGGPDVQRTVMDSVEENLKCDFGYLQSNPAYEHPDSTIGRLTYFAPGTYENGSVYNHGVAFKIYADLLLGRAENAYQSLQSILPTNPKNKGNGMEPYAIANMYFGPQAKVRAGYAPSSWITGTAGWVYRIISEMMLGIKPDYDGLVIDPCLPEAMTDVTVKRVFRGVTYHITLKRTGSYALFVDGKPVDGKKACLNGSSELQVTCEY